MLTTLIVIAAIMAVAAVVVWILASRQPEIFNYERRIVINASPERVKSFITDFHRWRRWSPYEDRDPQLKRTYSGPQDGKGAIYEWEGNKNVGKGRMEIIEVLPSKVTIKLDFFRPFEAHNTAEFLFMAEGNRTTATWRMFGPNACIGRVMGVFINMDRMVASDFATGLENLKAAAEAND